MYPMRYRSVAQPVPAASVQSHHRSGDQQAYRPGTGLKLIIGIHPETFCTDYDKHVLQSVGLSPDWLFHYVLHYPITLYADWKMDMRLMDQEIERFGSEMLDSMFEDIHEASNYFVDETNTLEDFDARKFDAVLEENIGDLMEMVVRLYKELVRWAVNHPLPNGYPCKYFTDVPSTYVPVGSYDIMLEVDLEEAL